MSVTQFQMWNLREIEKSLGFWFRVCRTDTASNCCETKKDSRETKNFLRGCNVSVMLRDDRQAKTEFGYPAGKYGVQAWQISSTFKVSAHCPSGTGNSPARPPIRHFRRSRRSDRIRSS